MNLTEPKNKTPFLERKSTTLLILVLGIITLALSVYNILQPESGIYSRNILVIGHAGSGFFSPLNPYNPLPANSMASIVKAMEEDGADGVEVDVHVSLDGVPILYHDNTLETMSEGVGIIADLPAAEVVGTRYKGGVLYDLFHSENIITMEAMLQRFQTYPELPYLHIDIRNQDPSRNTFYAESILTLLRKYNYPVEKLTFIFNQPAILHAVQELEPEAELMLDAGEDFDLSAQEALDNRLHGVTANGKHVNREQLLRAKARGLQVVLFGGKSKGSIANMLEMEPDAIQVNNVKRMRSLLDD
ncbi:glycerophosphodiester phosphodiesterase, cytosolic [Pontibacter sp. BAB1700]|uniref:Glycerophosphoryl diester phosphodiesterase n=1 Tax=Pontibacter lucknowensis TaxID=1077936 RepID=A0A1N7AAY7_9BACT|nr:glycerophosphodiester phosphodiesterase, cytosolic [Pontibacter sp. BAB1700]SIR36133.1 glycerophosphoryl diester phosphodiesterase [Pontibacter lucknowensis]